MRTRYVAVALILLGSAGHAWGAEELVTADGKRVRLNDDHTWEYVTGEEEAPPARQALLTVTRKVTLPNACRYGLTLENRTDVTVRNIVPQFTAITTDGVEFETIFRDFTQVRPTRTQYREIEFSGIACKDIARIRVHGADRCDMGELNKFSPDKGACLRQIRVVSNDIVAISK